MVQAASGQTIEILRHAVAVVAARARTRLWNDRFPKSGHAEQGSCSGERQRVVVRPFGDARGCWSLMRAVPIVLTASIPAGAYLQAPALHLPLRARRCQSRDVASVPVPWRL